MLLRIAKVSGAESFSNWLSKSACNRVARSHPDHRINVEHSQYYGLEQMCPDVSKLDVASCLQVDGAVMHSSVQHWPSSTMQERPVVVSTQELIWMTSLFVLVARTMASSLPIISCTALMKKRMTEVEHVCVPDGHSKCFNLVVHHMS